MMKCETKGCLNKAIIQQCYYPYERGCELHIPNGVCVSVKV
mgnify:CR=1 FL=1